MKTIQKSAFVASALTSLLVASSSNVWAAEGFKVRYPSAGTLGAELALFDVAPGLIGSIQVNDTDIRQINGNDGNQASLPPSVNAKGVSQTALVSYQQTNHVMQFLLGYVTPKNYAGGQIAVAFNLPYAINESRSLSFPMVSATTAAGRATTPGAAFLAGLNTQAAANDTSTGGFGDADLTVAWGRTMERLKVAAAVSVGLPTGNFNSTSTGAAGNPAINIGAGHFYSIRPSGTVAFRATDDLTLGARVSFAMNTRDTVDQWRSGNFVASELAASYRTPIGVFGPQVVIINQIQDDSGGLSGNCAGCYGANRYQSVGAGLFFATKIKGWALNLGYMNTFKASNTFLSSTVVARASREF
ncbi:MAG: transporter [Rhodoferax sp.]|nr:transporter [Rhodoferax sp.]